MKFKITATALALVMAGILHSQAQFQTVVTSGTTPATINIPAGQVMEVFNFTYNGSGGSAQLTKGSVTLSVLQPLTLAGGTGNIAAKSYYVGPATMVVAGNSSDSKLCLSYKLFDNATVSPMTVPSAAVVIPADATGPVNVILESSTDLITWTAATPGTYGSSTQKRFFRVRAVAQ